MATANLTSGEQHALDVLMALPEGEVTRVALTALEQRGDIAWQAPDLHSEQLDEAFVSELKRRVQAVETETATLVSAEDVYAELDAKLASHL